MIDLPELLLAHGVELKQRGQEYIACCINHDDHNPSMSVYINGDGTTWKCHCFSCDFHEGIVGVYCKLNGLDVENPEHVKQAYRAIEDGNPGASNYATIKHQKPITKRTPRKMMVPPHDTMPRMDGLKDHDTGEPMGKPVATWTFRTPEGNPLMYEARYVFAGKKEPRVFTYGQRPPRDPRWECAHWEGTDRPIYGLDRIATAKQVAIFEGCRKAEIAQKLLDEAGMRTVACTAWTGGCRTWIKSDWSTVGNLPIVLFPDHDEPGREAMRLIAKHLHKIAPRDMHMIDDPTRPDKWDIADEDWSPESFLAWIKANKREYKYVPKIEPKQDAANQDADDAPAGDDVPPSHTEPIPIEAYGETAEVWGTPGDVFDEFTAPSVKPHQLPQVIADWAFDVAPIVGVDPTMIVMPAIVACAGMSHDAIKLQPEAKNTGWRESARLWGAIVGDPSTKKSPAISKVLGIVKKIDSECHEKEGKLKYEFSIKEKAYAKAEAAYIEALSKGQAAELPPKPDYPEIPRALAQDFTVEALRDILKHSDRGILAERDELAGWFGSFDQYKSGGRGGADRSNWLELYNGGARRIDRVGGSVFVKNWSCSLIGGIQPEVIRQLAAGSQEDGLMQRFMIVAGKSGTLGNEQAPNHEYDQRWRNMVRQIWDTQPDIEPILLTDEANAIRKEICIRAFDLIKIKFVSAGLCAHLGKWEGLSARLMLTFHMIECASLKIHPQSCQINGETAKRVKAFMLEFLLPHATAFYMNLARNSVIGHAVNKVADLILASEGGEIGTQFIAQNWIGWRHLKQWEQEQLISILIDQNWLMIHPKARISRKGYPTRFWIHPEVRTINAERRAEEIERRKMDTHTIREIKDAFRDD